MERIISDEEKIRRAIEISQRRNKNYGIQRTAKVNVDNKKDYGLFKRMILQIIICLLIYSIFYLIRTTNYIFSEDVINQTSSILSYDINLYELYQKGVNSIKGFINKYQEQNNNISENEIVNNTTNNQEELNNIVEEGKEEDSSMTQMEKDAKTVKDKYSFIKPINGKVTSEFGEREVTSSIMTADHKGIDIAAKQGTKIKAAMEGQVEEADKNDDYGNYTKIKQGDVLTVYAHCEKLKVSKGDKVKKGDVIATVGSTGKSTGPHLHFEIRLFNRYINPRLVINF